MPDMVRLRRPVAPGDTVTLDDGQPGLVLRLIPTEPADEYEATVTTAAPQCIHCDEYSGRHSGEGRWTCSACGHEISREKLRDFAITYMINLGRFCDPIGASNEEWTKWWDEWKAEILADAAAAERLVNSL